MKFSRTNRAARLLLLAWVACLAVVAAQAIVLENQVVVVVNANGADSIAIGGFYTNLHPRARLVAIKTTTADSIQRPSFVSEIRDPIRNYLNSTPGLAAQIVSIVTTRGIPYQLSDPAGTGGNHTGFNQGLASVASVDAELTLLWQNMVAGNSFSNAYPANNIVFNPYFGTPSAISSFSRANIQVQKNWSTIVKGDKALVFESPGTPFNGKNAFGFSTRNTEPVANQLTKGDFYLVTRLSGYSVTDVTNSIARSVNIEFRKKSDVIVLDGTPSGFDTAAYNLRGTVVYDNARKILSAAGFLVAYDRTDTAITSLPNGQRLLSYSSSGIHSAPGNPLCNNPQYINKVLRFNYAAGAVFNTYESSNGSEFNNPAHANQGMVADFIHQGGTLGFGHVGEPFTIAMANEDYYLSNLLLNGLTWAEAAYSALPFLSWQNIVIGNPLTRFTITASNNPPAPTSRP
jgi:uncharacterized protein (TIGR03790 family)